MKLANLNEIQTLIDRGAIFYVSHSGGKDSQAMYHAVCQVVPHHQIIVVHADLGDLEHDGVQEHILNTIKHQLLIAHAYDKDGNRTDLFKMIRSRRAKLDAQGKHDAPAFPSSAARFCTSDLKTGPIWRVIRNAGEVVKQPIVVNCVGIRAHESDSRAKKVARNGTLNVNKKNTNNKREAYDWWPIAHWTDQEVWHEIVNEAYQLPHPAYKLTGIENEDGWLVDFKVNGNERLSCQFCIFGSRNDLRRAKEANPELYQRYIDLEIEVRTTMFHGESLADRTK
jgi:3'-phosphoadenosine 5'-phosphosulfate sulfotransferase (PAPS reductase)/FAD synthetase